MFDSFELFIAHFAFDHIRGGRTDHRFSSSSFRNFTHCTVESASGQTVQEEILQKDVRILSPSRNFFVKGIYRRFCKNGLACFFKNIIRYIFHIITNQYLTPWSVRIPSQIFTEFMPQDPLPVQQSRLFHIYLLTLPHKFPPCLYWLVSYLVCYCIT